ncbi:MAG: hypothetical protein A2283_13615 [Lentisphaerae bacterium RIFOXYA12_FULL_48_11]|nr:MAG: hypothetical protein A2283_13615 [Lentisphaerae bacterium RIFOXYA12_FULL_48_11]
MNLKNILGRVGLVIIFMSSIAAAVPLDTVVGVDGKILIRKDKNELCDFHAGLFDKNWVIVQAGGDFKSVKAGQPVRKLNIKTPSGNVTIPGVATFSVEPKGALKAEYVFTPGNDVPLQCLYVSAEFNVPTLAGGKWTAGEKTGTFPADFKEMSLFCESIQSLKLDLPSGETMELAFPAPTMVLLQDNRKWGPSFAVRIYRSPAGGGIFKKDEPVKIAFTISTKEGLAVNYDEPITLAAGDEWVPLNLDLDIEKDSALDFSSQGFLDAPAGKLGWIQASADGHFVFEKDPRKKPRRFYGVNFCFSALYLSHEQADQLADRLARLGYNTVRVHHYEGELCKGQKDSLTFNPEKIDQLDYFLAACFKRGIYVTTDLFVSRPVPRAEIGLTGGGNVAMDEYKDLVPAHEKAFENWKAFSRNLLTHVNPYTQRSYANEPGLAWIALINEGNLGNFFSKLKNVPEWNVAWNKWLAGRYADREALAKEWGRELKEGEDFTKGNVPMPSSLYDKNVRVRDAIAFLSWMEKDFFRRASDFLKKELGVKALLTNMSCWTNHATDQDARSTFDFVDDHFYVDHPHFIEHPWRLPSRCDNNSPIAGGATGGRHCSFTRLLGKPFTITEYNYSAPGRFRGVGGILTGTLGALQDWDGIWRFGYSHSRDNIFKASAMNYFDMATDPLGQAAERASMCLFLRGDIQPAPDLYVVNLNTEKISRQPKIPNLAPNWHWMAWLARIGTKCTTGETEPHTVEFQGGAGKAETLANVDPYKADATTLLRKLSQGNASDPAKKIFCSVNGEVTIDAQKDTLLLDTGRTAGGYAPAGQKIMTRNGVEITVQDADATVWVSSLDDKVIVDSKHLLITHLTDCQNTEIKYAEKSRKTLLAWGRTPHLIRAGKAEVRVKLKNAEDMKVYALATSGKRLGNVPCKVDGSSLVFTADVAGAAKDQTAVMCYEIAP